MQTELSKVDRVKFSETHKRKLQNFGLHVSRDELNVFVNSSQKKFTSIEEHQAFASWSALCSLEFIDNLYEYSHNTIQGVGLRVRYVQF